MNRESVIKRILHHWQHEDGFLFQWHLGKLDHAAHEDLYDLIRSLELRELDSLPRDVLTLIWRIPHFLVRYEDLVVRSGIDELVASEARYKLTELVCNEIEGM